MNVLNSSDPMLEPYGTPPIDWNSDDQNPLQNIYLILWVKYHWISKRKSGEKSTNCNLFIL